MFQTYPVLDPVVEDDVHHCPGAVVDSSRGRDVVCPNEDQWPIHLFQPVLLGVLPGDICYDRHQCSDPEEVQEAAIDLADTVKSAWAYKSPDHGCRTLARR